MMGNCQQSFLKKAAGGGLYLI